MPTLGRERAEAAVPGHATPQPGPGVLDRDVAVVSLGSWCGVKAALRGLALGGPTMPFDWIRISGAGLAHALETDFADFLKFDSMSECSTSYIAAHHRFFHDVLDDPRDVEKYRRRFARFRGLRDAACSGGHRRPLVFVRTPDTTVELERAVELYDLLVGYFDDTVYLLLILDCQHADRMVFFEERPRLLVYTVSQAHINPHEYEIDRQPFVTAYHEAVLASVWHALYGWRPSGAASLPSLAALMAGESGILRHVSLGEDLERYNYGIPQMPPDAVLQRAMSPEGRATREYVKAAAQARADWEVATRNPPENSKVADDFLRWMCAQPD